MDTLQAATPWVLSFSSQTVLQPYGHLICTPISLLASTTYLNAHRIHSMGGIFTHQNIIQMMEASHRLYAELFSQHLKGQPLMIQELYAWIPKEEFAMKEAAGLILPASDNPVDKPLLKIKKEEEALELEIIPLILLIQKTLLRAREEGKRWTVIVTAKGHTISYLCSEMGELFVFDSLPGILALIPLAFCYQQIFQQFGVTPHSENGNAEFSALILTKK